MLYHNFVIITDESYFKVLLICYNVLQTHLPNEQRKESGKTTSTEKGGISLDRFNFVIITSLRRLCRTFSPS